MCCHMLVFMIYYNVFTLTVLMVKHFIDFHINDPFLELKPFQLHIFEKGFFKNFVERKDGNKILLLVMFERNQIIL